MMNLPGHSPTRRPTVFPATTEKAFAGRAHSEQPASSPRSLVPSSGARSSEIVPKLACQPADEHAAAHAGPESALKIAIGQGNLPGAIRALESGADPERVNAGESGDGMRALLTYARRKNKLYPPIAPSDGESDLDRALRNGPDSDARKQAVRLLNQGRWGKSTRNMWRDAVKNDQRDVQRALLLLEADSDPTFRIFEKRAVEDKGVAQVAKEIPYFSPKRGEPRDFNCKVPFADSDTVIVCSDFVEHRQSAQERDERLKFNDSQFSSAEAIQAHVPSDTQDRFRHLTSHATEAHLLYNRDFGNLLVKQFAAMETAGITVRLILLVSTDHAMSVGLRIKDKDRRPRYVATFFEPGATTSHVRVASDSLRTFETLSAKNFVAGDHQYKHYFSDPYHRATALDSAQADHRVCLMFVRPQTREDHGTPERQQDASKNRTLASCLADKEIKPTAFWHILAEGFAGDIRRLKNEFACRPKKDLLELLTARDDKGIPGLYMTLQDGHADAIEAFGELLDLLPPEARAEVVAARNNGIPGFHTTLQKGLVDAIKAFGELVKRVPIERRSELVAAKDADMLPGLYWLLENGDVDAIKAFGNLLPLIPSQHRAGFDELSANVWIAQVLREASAEVREAFENLHL